MIDAENKFNDVIMRAVTRNERLFPIQEEHTPLVIEPTNNRNVRFLKIFLAAHSPQILRDIAVHGAVLLRGFDIGSVAEFEEVVLSIEGMEGMKDVFMAEEGRTLVEGTRFVLHTSTLAKTGGTLYLGGFHTENYYTTDVPRYICFHCIRPSSQGGETGLVNTAGVYEDLSPELKEKLAAHAMQTATIPFSQVMERYGVSSDVVQRFCEERDLEIEERDGVKFLKIYKPSILEHPVTKEKVLTVNFSSGISQNGLDVLLRRVFTSDYAGLRWAAHRLVWRLPWLPLALQTIDFAFRNPGRTLTLLRSLVKEPAKQKQATAQVPPVTRFRDLFTKEETEKLAVSVRQHHSSFLWQKGDVLLVDNLKMAHAGMPGFGPRDLKVMICNRTPLPCSSNSHGLFAPSNANSECLGATLVKTQAVAATVGLQ